MKPQARREIVLLCAISAGVLMPLLFLGLKSTFAPRAAPSAPVPVPVKRTSSGGVVSRAALSPSGRFIARMESSASTAGTNPAPGALSPIADQIVIRASASGQEVFRDGTAGQFRAWVPGSNSFVAQNGLDFSVFAPPTRRPGAPAPTQPWISTLLSFPAGSDAIATELGAGGSQELVFQTGAIALSPDNRFVVKAAWDKGDIWWQVADLTTGKIAPPIRAGRWLKFDPEVGGFSNDIAVSIAPARLTQGRLPIVCVIQKAVDLAPIPLPTPRKLSAAQQKFMDRMKREDWEDFRIRNLATDPNSSLSPARRGEYLNQMMQRSQGRRDRDAEYARLFPPSAADRWRSQHPDLKETQAFELDCFDLNTRKKLWARRLRSDFSMPQTKFSPDGAALVAWNTARIVRDENYGTVSVKDTGVELLAPLSGKTRAQFRLYGDDFSIPQPEQACFYFQSAKGTLRSILTLKDARNIQTQVSSAGKRPVMQSSEIPVLRFFDTTTAREIGHLDVNLQRFPSNFEVEPFSSDDSGQFWLLSRGDYVPFSRAQLGTEKAVPLPRPTSEPTATTQRSSVLRLQAPTTR